MHYYFDFYRLTIVTVLRFGYKYIDQRCKVIPVGTASWAPSLMTLLFTTFAHFPLSRLKIVLSLICRFFFKVLRCTLELEFLDTVLLENRF